jgi:hypothetical protein
MPAKDQYDEKAASIHGCSTPEWAAPCGICVSLAAFGRQCAAEAHAAGKAEGREEALNEATKNADVLVRALFYCASILSAKTPDSLGAKTVIAEWNKRAQHCWERATEAAKVYEFHRSLMPGAGKGEKR